jgi:cupin superfamily acireductone dioxygenase involved in methionine salvage
MAWSKIDDQFTIDDIGARLLANLARGIYNHEAVLREYVQNACDAYAALPVLPEYAAIKISIEDEDTIAIQDDGIGMDLKDIKASKKIAVSPKSDMEGMTGFRGIGIWAGFQACDQLEIVTTKAGSSHRFRLQIDFADILEHVDEDINIKALLDGRFRIHQEDTQADDHYTRVRLIGLQGDYRKLTEREELERIASQILPSKIDENFKYNKAISQFLDPIYGYQEYSILVEGGEVFRQFPEGLGEPRTHILKRDGEEYGRVWYCSGNRSLKIKRFEYRNFRLRARNFAVGRIGIYDDEDGSGYGIIKTTTLRSTAHLNWHVGEIHITHPDIRPDTPRSSLELDGLARRGIEEIRTFYEDCISDSRARSDFNKYREQVERSEQLFAKNAQPELQVAKSLLYELNNQEQETRGRRPADKIKSRLRELLGAREFKARRRKQIAILNKYIMDSTPSPKTDPGATGKTATQENARQDQPTTKEASSQSSSESNLSSLPVNFEKLLSDIFAAVESKVAADDELYAEICEAIQNVFKGQGLIDA